MLGVLMSRVGGAPIPLPEGVRVAVADGVLQIEGKKGSQSMALSSTVEVTEEDGVLRVKSVSSRTKQARAMWGLTRALAANMVRGVSEGFEKTLELQGVGYRAQAQGSNLKLALGYSHDINYAVREGVEVECPNATTVIVRGMNRQHVGQVAAEIRRFHPPEPYKGKGVRYAGEYVYRKEGKKK